MTRTGYLAVAGAFAAFAVFLSVLIALGHDHAAALSGVCYVLTDVYVAVRAGLRTPRGSR